MRRTVLSLTVLLAATAIVVLPAGAREQATPGLTKGTITLGGTFPLSGPASSYAPIPAGMKAYFSYINSRRAKDGRRGVNGRQIVFKYLDDGYNPANTVQLTRQLVEQDHVFALVGGLGTEPTQAARTYANQMGVPQLYVSTGASEFGTKGKEYPWTIGWQPDYEAEGQVYGKYIVANMPNVKIGIIYQNDDYGKDYIRGLEAGLGAKKSLIVSRQGFEVTATSVASQVAAIKSTGADTFVILATPGKTVQTYATAARLGYKPDNTIVNSVSAAQVFMKASVANAGAAQVNGSISVQYLKDPASPTNANDPTIKLYKRLMAKYLPGKDTNDGNYYYGFAKAYTIVDTLKRAGKNLTRKGVMNAALHLNEVNPFALKGVVVKTSPNDRFPISQLQLIKFNNGQWSTISKVFKGR